MIATSGDSHLGGDDFNAVIVNWVYEQIITQHGNNICNMIKGDVFAASRLMEAAEQSKILLSSQAEVSIQLPYLYKDISIDYSMTRKKFEYLCRPLFQRLLKPVREVAVLAGVNLPGESGLMGAESMEFESVDMNNNNNKQDDSDNKNVLQIDEKFLKLQQTQGKANARNRNKLKGETMKQVVKLQKMTGESSLTSFPGMPI